MRIFNPDYVAPVVALKDQPAHVKYADAVLTAIKSDTAKQVLTFDEVRSVLGKDAKALPDGAIAQICQYADIKVETA